MFGIRKILNVGSQVTGMAILGGVASGVVLLVAGAETLAIAEKVGVAVFEKTRRFARSLLGESGWCYDSLFDDGTYV